MSQQQLDDLLERLVGLTRVADADVRQARLAQLVLLLIGALNDTARAHAVMDEMEQRHATVSCIPIP